MQSLFSFILVSQTTGDWEDAENDEKKPFLVGSETTDEESIPPSMKKSVQNT